MRILNIGLAVIALVLGGVAAADVAAQAAPGTQISQDFADRCDALNNLDIQRVADRPGQIVAAEVVANRAAVGRETIMFIKRGHSQGNLVPTLDAYPPHCKVVGYITPNVQFNMVLPLDDKWQKRFMLAACDAWCGKAGEDIVVPGLYNGYATITNNGGHYGRAPFDGIWAHRNIPAREDFAYAANHVSAQVGKYITAAFYGEPAAYSYISGFSKGGNAGLMAAQRYPEDFDGVFVKAPVVNYNAKNAAHFTWLALAVHPDGKTPLLQSDKIPLLHKGVMDNCDAKDGLKDGIIDDPRVCEYDPIVLLCKPGQSEASNECLSMPQVEAVRKIYAKPVNDRGEVYFDYPTDISSEHDWARSILSVPGSTEPGTPFALNGAITGLRYMVMRDNPGPDYDWTTFDYVKEKSKIDDMAMIMDPDSVDLSAFKARGGKLIIVHGWGDAMISAQMTIDWFAKMREAMGGAEETAEFAQLYLIPGMDHGSGGSGPYIFDTQTKLVKWVEEGIAPTQLLVSDPEPDGTDTSQAHAIDSSKRYHRSRYFYPWPDISRYRGSGDASDPASFRRVKGE